MRSSSHTVWATLDLLRGLLVLTGLWGAGTVLRFAVPLPLPGSLWGMLLLFVLLRAGWLPEAWVARAAHACLAALGLLFVPVGVGIVAFESLMRANLVPVALALPVGSALTALAAVWAVGRRRA